MSQTAEQTPPDPKSAAEGSAVRYERDDDGVVTLVLDDPRSSANTMNAAYRHAMGAALDRLEADRDGPGGLTGVVVTSAKRTFFAGGDLRSLADAGPGDAAEVFALAEEVKAQLRRLETLGRPVVAALNGSALGGGLEIALACHRRVCVDDPRVEIGLPEVTLGLLPGGGGVTRTVRMLGLATALQQVLLPGTRMDPAAAKEIGLVDALVAGAEQLLPAARGWIQAHRDDPEAATQPWDRAGYRMPGGTPSSPKLAAVLPAFPATLRKQLKGADLPAPRALLAAAVEGAQVDVDTATRIESRYFTSLATGPVSGHLIDTLFFDRQALASGALRPEGHPRFEPALAGVVGAGMMGAGIAYVLARSGLPVVLVDTDLERAEQGREHARRLLQRSVDRGRLSEPAAREVLARITPADDVALLAGADLVVEAVFEDPALKATVFAAVEDVVAADALLATNTSTLPVTGLAEAVGRPEDVVGLHFFSPVHRMPLVEVVRGERTSEASVARALDVVRRIGKTPIVVRDSRGFYTSRVIGTYVDEALAMLAEGVAPSSVERAATKAGYPVGPLQLADELNLELLARIRKANADALAASGRSAPAHPAAGVVETMLRAGRAGRLRGAGFYEYDEGGRRLGLWPGFADTFPAAGREPAFGDLAGLADRFRYIEAVETARCFAEGVIDSAAAADVGAVLGIGYPAATGGTARFIEHHPGGIAGFVDRARELASAHGDRFSPPAYLEELVATGGHLPA